MINWKIEITENETKLVIPNGPIMSGDVLDLARFLVNKYDLVKLPIYHENGNKYFDYTFNEEVKCSSFPLVFLLTKTKELFNQLGYTNELAEINLKLNFPQHSDYHANCLLRISFLNKDNQTKHPNELYLFDMKDLKWSKKKEKNYD